MSVDRPGETEAELVDRRGREADERYLQHLAAIEEHRRNGTLIHMGPAIQSDLEYMPRGGVWS